MREASGSHEKFTCLALGVSHPFTPRSSLAPGPGLAPELRTRSLHCLQTPAASSELVNDANESGSAPLQPRHKSHRFPILLLRGLWCFELLGLASMKSTTSPGTAPPRMLCTQHHLHVPEWMLLWLPPLSTEQGERHALVLGSSSQPFHHLPLWSTVVLPSTSTLLTPCSSAPSTMCGGLLAPGEHCKGIQLTLATPKLEQGCVLRWLRRRTRRSPAPRPP